MDYLSYIEKKSHGTPSFPFEYYLVDENHPRYQMPFHWHREIEISYILSGSYTFFLNEKVITATKGDVVFIPGGIIHGGTPDSCIYECVVFNPYPLLPNIEACKNYISEIIAPEKHIYPHFKAGHPICEETARLMKSARRQTRDMELSVITEIYRFFMIVEATQSFSNEEKQEAPDLDKMQALKPVLRFIEENYMQPVTLKDLAQRADMSTSHFCRFFKAVTHYSPIDYLIYYRIERACGYFASAELSVTEVMYQCGFNDMSYFIHVFKRHKGITPKQYQKQYQK